jgi:hypothetical protein
MFSGLYTCLAVCFVVSLSLLSSIVVENDIVTITLEASCHLFLDRVGILLVLYS